MSHSTDAPGQLPPGSGEDRAHLLRIGRELFEGRTGNGDVITFVCYDHGYGLRRNGQLVPGRWWDADGSDDALAAFQDLVRPTVRLVAPPAA